MTSFLLFCSGVSQVVLEKCPDSEKIKHVSIGASVLFTGILAIISSYFAFSLIFESAWINLFIAIFWGLIIFNLDRYIVATLRKKNQFIYELMQISPRLILSICIALVVAKPLELQIFKSEIDQQLGEDLIQKNHNLEQRYAVQFAIIDDKKKAYESQSNHYFELKEFYYQEYKCECDGTCGTGQQGRGEECLRKKEKYENFITEFYAKERAIQASILELNAEADRFKSQLLEEKEHIQSSFSSGLLARIQALNRLDSWAPWAVTLMILFVEIAPVLTKLFASQGPYDELLALEESKYKIDYMKKFYQSEEQFDNEYVGKLHDIKLIRNELIAEKQSRVKQDYRDLAKELSKQLKR
ncbi:DUF4407 domain-containing protein [Belliella aquatica]|nr:DUF4407 domain-containing protein [Belliella aquatica]MCH7406322.1 DUF4407 domain-containing protein [Belliella aquatica]